MALRSARDVERAFHREIFALVVEDVKLGRIGIDAVALVLDEGVVVPAVPEARTTSTNSSATA